MDRTHAVTYGMDSRIYTLAYLGLLLIMRGRLNEAAARNAEARAWARELGVRHVTCATLFGLACLHHLRGERAPIVPLSDEMRQVVAAYGFSFYAPMTELFRAWAERDLPTAEGILGQMSAYGGVAGFGLWVSMVAELLGENGREAEAVAKLDERIAHHDDGSTYLVPELLRLKGEILLKAQDTRDRGKAALRDAIGRARELSAPFFELRAAHALAEVLVAEGRAREARNVLGEVLPRFGNDEVHPLLASARAAFAKLNAAKTG